MALGDLLAEDYQIEYNGLLIGPNTPYDLLEIPMLFGFRSRSSTVTKFGRHGGTGGRNYTNVKSVDIQGNLIADTDTEFETRRQALGLAFASVVNPANSHYMAFRLPGASSLDLRVQARPLNVDLPITPAYGRKNPSFLVRLEVVNPIIEGLSTRTTLFTMPSDTNTINNAGNAPAHWVGTLNGPATNPTINNILTGQSISFQSLTIATGETLVYDSLTGRVSVNGVGKGLALAPNFSWFTFGPGDTAVQFTATNASTASFQIALRDSYWIP